MIHCECVAFIIVAVLPLKNIDNNFILKLFKIFVLNNYIWYNYYETKVNNLGGESWEHFQMLKILLMKNEKL